MFQGLSWDVGHEATWGLTEDGEDVWELVIVSDAAVGNGDLIYFKPLINDEVWGKGVDYVVKPGLSSLPPLPLHSSLLIFLNSSYY